MEEVYILPAEVAIHNKPDDVWVSFLGKVYDLSSLVEEYDGQDVIKPLLAYAGKDISEWFDPRTKDIQHYIHPITGARVPYIPHGRIPDVGPQVPTTAWRPLERLPWWTDPKYVMGNLTEGSRIIRVINVLIGREFKISCANIVVLLAGVAEVPGKASGTRADLFDVNANIVKEFAENCVEICPTASLVIVSNPVNSMVPLACEVFKKAGKPNDCGIFGLTTLDLVRASTFVAEEMSLDPCEVYVPVIGAHSGPTIIPLFSQTTPEVCLSEEQVKRLTISVKEAFPKVVKAKGGKGSTTLGPAFAAARFTLSLTRALLGEKNVVECSYVKSDIVPCCDYFSTPLQLGCSGIKKICGLPDMNEFEKALLEKAIPEIQKDIKKGVDFVNKPKDPCGEREKKCQ